MSTLPRIFAARRERTFIVRPKDDPDPIVFQGTLNTLRGAVAVAAADSTVPVDRAKANLNYMLSGTLRAADGKPVPTATVRIWSPTVTQGSGYLDREVASVQEGKFDLFLGIRFFDCARPAGPPRSCNTTNRQSARPGMSRWNAWFARLEPIKFTFDKEIKPLAIVLDRPRFVTIRGASGADGQPAAKANVCVSLSTVGDAVECPWGPEYSTESDGRFEIKHVYVGNRFAVQVEQGPLKAESTRMVVQNAEPLDLDDLRLTGATPSQPSAREPDVENKAVPSKANDASSKLSATKPADDPSNDKPTENNKPIPVSPTAVKPDESLRPKNESSGAIVNPHLRLVQTGDRKCVEATCLRRRQRNLPPNSHRQAGRGIRLRVRIRRQQIPICDKRGACWYARYGGLRRLCRTRSRLLRQAGFWISSGVFEAAGVCPSQPYRYPAMGGSTCRSSTCRQGREGFSEKSSRPARSTW